MAPTKHLWQKTVTGGKTGFGKLWGWADKMGAPANRLSNKLGSEAFWPTTLDKESDKAARILLSFCKDGFYDDIATESTDGPKQQQNVLKKIPASVIQNAKGLAIFTTMRTGLWISGAGGSGVLVARLPDGSWSPPSGLMLHTAGVGFLVGVDIYDCVMVINTEEALSAFQKVRCTIGGEISAVAGPVGIGGILDSEVTRRAPIFTYMKSRGFYAGVQIDGTILIERSDENERFYGYRVPALDILSGKVRHPPYEVRALMQTIKAAQGDRDFDEKFLPTEPPPSDFDIETDEKIFGVPDRDDPDPYGVMALEKEGMHIREAGTQERPSWEQFTFNPAPSSPAFSAYNRESLDGGRTPSRTGSRRSSWRASTLSNMTNGSAAYTDHTTQTQPSDMGAHSDSDYSVKPRGSIDSGLAEIPEEVVKPLPATPSGIERVEFLSPALPALPASPTSPKSKDSSYKADNEGSDNEDDFFDAEVAVIAEPVVVHQIHQTASPQRITRARVVQVAKKPQAPALPPRNPVRHRRMHSAASAEYPFSSPRLPVRDPAHSRTSSMSTFREQEQSSSHRSGSDLSLSSIEHVNVPETPGEEVIVKKAVSVEKLRALPVMIDISANNARDRSP